ncbi:MAG: CcoQ/FixQ family Cbb3-type cytochrome c oxidase assembly chaperone [Bacteroidia bacterium]|jgi:capsule polysaccharide export protein KpsE/RkpR
MKFINYLKSIQDVRIFPMVSLFIFTAIFAVVLMYAMKASKKYINQAKQIPLGDEKEC